MQTEVKWDAKKISQVALEAQNAGRLAGQAKLDELKKAGPQWVVYQSDVITGKRIGNDIGTMLDVCGGAYIVAKGTDPFIRAVKKYGDPWGVVSVSKGYPTGYMVHIKDTLGRQEMSVNEAVEEAIAVVLRKYGVDASVRSYID